jgi:phytoene dehydrogenase-like protein
MYGRHMNGLSDLGYTTVLRSDFHTLTHMGPLRPSNRDPVYRGLYYVGGSTHPGGGTPMVLHSANLVYQLICRYEFAS